MIGWILSLLGLRPEPAQTRCPKPPVKPRLEGLEERIVPSDSPVDAEEMSQMVSTVIQVLSTVENEVSSDVQMIDQQMAQKVAAVVRQLDQLLGIAPTVPNPSPASTVPQPASGSGSGSSATTTAHNAPLQQLKSGTMKSGSGSGSDATTTAHEKAAIQRVKPLTGSGSGSGSSGDTYIWDPPPFYPNPSGSGSLPGDLYASDARNWLKNNNAQLYGGTIPGNSSTDTAMLSGDFTDQPIEWDYDAVFSTLEVQDDYNAWQTIDDGMELTGVDGGLSLSEDPGTPSGFVAKQAAQPMAGAGPTQLNQTLKSNVKVDGDQGITNWNLTTSGGNFQYIINGGTTSLGSASGYTDSIGATITINAGATLLEYSFSPIEFTAANVPININTGGTMTVYYSYDTGSTILDNGGQAGDYLNVNGGTLTYKGSSGKKDKFIEPVLVQKGGTFTVTSISNSSGGYLTVAGQTAQTQKYSVYMSGGNVNLSTEATLECDDDYKQTSGTLQTTDVTECTLQDLAGANGTAVIAGGNLTINGQNSSGQLDVKGNLDFAGQFLVGIQGNNSGKQGVLNVIGTMNQLAGNSLSVGVNGQLGNGTWPILYTTGNINIFGGNAGGLTQVPNKPGPGDLELTNP